MENDQPTIDQLLKNMGRYQGVAAGPLGEVNFVPDVVIIEGQVEKLMWIALAWLKGIKITLMLLGLVFVSSSLEAGETWLTDFPAAQKAAQEKGLIVLAAFVGSDWCPWCQKLETGIFNQSEFKDFAKDRFILFLADFPRHKELPEGLKNQNQELKKQFAVKSYPTVLFLDAGGKEISRMGYKAGGVASYLEAIKAKIPQLDSGTKEAVFPVFPSFQQPMSP